MNRSLWEAANQNFMINQPELAAEPQEGFEIKTMGDLDSGCANVREEETEWRELYVEH